MRRWAGALVSVALLTGAFAWSAAADDAATAVVDPKVAEARRLFAEGASLADLGRWSEALEKFEASAALRPHATTTYDIGYCERALGHPTRAKRFFERAL